MSGEGRAPAAATGAVPATATAPAAAAPAAAARGRRPWTLSRRLVVGTAALVAAVLLAVGIVSIATLTASVTTVVDTQLTGSMSALSHSAEKFRYGNMAQNKPAKSMVDFVGHGPGSFIAVLSDGTVDDSAYFSDSDAATLDPTVIGQLENGSIDVGTHQNLQLAGLGSYRVASELDSQGNVLVTGVSMATAEAAVLQETITIVVLALLALAVIVVGVIVVVRLALRPLARVVGTAVEVVDTPLDRGDVAITTRVAEADTDPRTEVGKVGEALNRLLVHVGDALAVRAATDKRMRRFVTDASHELRTPLAAIQGYAELTRQDSAELPEITEYSLARIESEAKRMNSLVSDLLLLARLDEGQDLHLDQIDLGEIVVNAISDAKASAAGHVWVAEVPDAPALVSGDRERLHQLVLNLLSNAAVHTPEGSTVTTRVRVVPDAGTGVAGTGGLGMGGAGTGGAGTAGAGAEQAGAERLGAGDAVEVTIADDGPGIAPELIPELFERFARGDSSRSRRAGSSGLGLAIVASIVEAHDGTITVDSTPSGTTFTLRLARVAGAVAAPPASARAAAPATRISS